jgi:hypothetical protein
MKRADLSSSFLPVDHCQSSYNIAPAPARKYRLLQQSRSIIVATKAKFN